MNLHFRRGDIECDGVPVGLTRKEAAIVECLLQRPRHLWPRAALIRHLYGGIDEPDSAWRCIDVFVCHIRRKIPRCPIVMVRGRGLIWDADTPAELRSFAVVTPYDSMLRHLLRTHPNRYLAEDVQWSVFGP